MKDSGRVFIFVYLYVFPSHLRLNTIIAEKDAWEGPVKVSEWSLIADGGEVGG